MDRHINNYYHLCESDLDLCCNLMMGEPENSDFWNECAHKYNWDLLYELIDKYGKVILYGAGFMCEFFLNAYSDIPVKYVVDKNAASRFTGYYGSTKVYTLDKLTEESKDAPIVITPVFCAKDIYFNLKNEGFSNVFVFAAMEYAKKEVLEKIDFLKDREDEKERYLQRWKQWNRNRAELSKLHSDLDSTKKQLAELRKQFESLKKHTEEYREGSKVHYSHFLHTNRIVNILVDALPDEELRKGLIEDQIKYRFCEQFKNGYIPDLSNPQSFNEKNIVMQIKEADNPLFATVTDKYEMKKWVADKIGEEYVVPALGIWDSTEEIEWEKLPERFVLKATNGGDAENVFLVEENNDSTRQIACKLARKWLMKSEAVYYSGFNGVFKHVPQRLLAEENIETIPGDLVDYGFWMFHGKPAFYYVKVVNFNKPSTETRVTYCKMDGTPFDAKSMWYKQVGDYRHSNRMDEMIELAEKLAEPFEFVRVDFMETSDRLKVGELTLTPSAGMRAFDTRELDVELGKYW